MTDNLDKEEIIFQSRFSKEEVREFFEKDTKFYHTMNINGIKTENTRTSSEYQKWISQVIPNDLTDKKILEHNFNYSIAYKTQDEHSDTLKLENQNIENLINKTYQDAMIKISQAATSQ